MTVSSPKISNQYSKWFENLFVMHTLGKGPKETVTFSTVRPPKSSPALSSWRYRGGCCHLLSLLRKAARISPYNHPPRQQASQSLPAANSVTSPVQEERHEPSPAAVHAPAYMTWFPHQDHNSCKVMRCHAQASIIFDSNHLQTSWRPSVNPADLLHCWFFAAHRNIWKNTTITFVHSLTMTLLRKLENKMIAAISLPL